MAHIDTAISERTRRRPAKPIRKPASKATGKKPTEHFIDPAKLPATGKYALRVNGDCMEPAVMHGAHVIVDPATEPKTGDLVVIYLKKGYHWQSGTNLGNVGLKRLVFNMMEGVKYPYVAHPDSNVIPVLIVEQENPRRQYQLRADVLLAVHKCLGPAPKGAKLVEAAL
jgi:hypothetical protein